MCVCVVGFVCFRHSWTCKRQISNANEKERERKRGSVHACESVHAKHTCPLCVIEIEMGDHPPLNQHSEGDLFFFLSFFLTLTHSFTHYLASFGYYPPPLSSSHPLANPLERCCVWQNDLSSLLHPTLLVCGRMEGTFLQRQFTNNNLKIMSIFLWPDRIICNKKKIKLKDFN